MTMCVRGWLGIIVLMGAITTGRAEGVTLHEDVKPGECFQYEITLNIAGKMKVQRDNKTEDLPIRATARHEFVERTESPAATGGIGMAVRHYQTATSTSETAGERTVRSLSAERRLIVAKRNAQGSLHFSPNGPLSREELDLVAEHFDTLCLPALLPDQELNPGQSWTIRPEAAEHACLFDGLIKNELVGKLVAVANGVAEFTITGQAEGIEYGARAQLTITAKGKFDMATKRMTELSWEQIDQRELGPASPATELKATVTLKRTALADVPETLSAAARAKVPAADATVPDAMTQLHYAMPSGQYRFQYARNWHIVGRTRDHLVMRLLDRGEFTAQATITNWKKADPGQHTTPAEFKGVLNQLPNWQAEQILNDGEIPTSAGRWLYRVTAQGKQDGLAVVQSFYLLAGPNGEQVAVTVVTRQEKAVTLGSRDLDLVQSIVLGQPTK
ncbi:MAG: hypothetical protein LC104_03640 [Bacteroidales bacterium]|nr:hypothetical protein [Bacteroidales bacterium]